FRRAVFVSLEYISDVRSVLINLGKQLLPEGDKWYIAPNDDLEKACQHIERALRDQPTIFVFDNIDSVLPDPSSTVPTLAPIEELLALFQKLLEADPATRLLFTSRESLPAPFDNRRQEIELGGLSQDDAIELVSQVMAQEGWKPPTSDGGETP